MPIRYPNINDREMNKFDICNEVHVRTDEQKLVKIDRVNSNLTYEGRADHGTEDSFDHWQIKRILSVGSITTTEYADNGNYTQVWNNRATIFTPGTILNLYSTSFDGVNDYVDFGDIHNYTQAQAFSFSLWLKVNNLAASRYIISNMDMTAPVTGWRMRIDTAVKIQTQLRASTSSLGFYTFNTILSPSVWYHLVWTYNGGSNINGQKLYINSVLDTYTPPSTNIAGTGWGTTATLLLGQSAGSGFYSGNIDEVSFYDKALSQAEVNEIYNLGSPNDLNSLTMAGNLKSWWRMGDNDVYPTIIDQKGTGNGNMLNMSAANFSTDVP